MSFVRLCSRCVRVVVGMFGCRPWFWAREGDWGVVVVVVVGDFEKWSVERGIDVVECGSVVDSVERFREPFGE